MQTRAFKAYVRRVTIPERPWCAAYRKSWEAW